MEAREFEEFCRVVNSGQTRYVENVGSHETGRVMFCSGNRVEVEIGDRRETWAYEFCRDAGENPEGTEPPQAG